MGEDSMPYTLILWVFSSVVSAGKSMYKVVQNHQEAFHSGFVLLRRLDHMVDGSICESKD